MLFVCDHVYQFHPIAEHPLSIRIQANLIYARIEAMIKVKIVYKYLTTQFCVCVLCN